ncbi:MAG: hypothetical protein NDJ90_09015 [Oligoflexia bacterium]|nr:hypothetical protein [Oligoflexia bacterium]
MELTVENYTQGFLVDEELLGGVTPHPEEEGKFVAFVLNHHTGEYLAYQSFATIGEALEILSQVQRPWKFEKISGCGGSCGGSGGCGGKSTGGCGGHDHEHGEGHEHGQGGCGGHGGGKCGGHGHGSQGHGGCGKHGDAE